MEPVLGGDVVLRDGDEAREPRLRGEQIVRAGVEPSGARVVADGEEAALLVVEEREVHRRHERARASRDLEQENRVGGLLHDHRLARGGQRDEMSGEIAGVHRRDVRRIEDAQVGEIVPVHQVPAHLRHLLHRIERVLEPFEHHVGRDEAEVVRRDGREELEADVGGRRPRRDHRLRRLLEVVRHEPVRGRPGERLHVVPVQLRARPQRGFALGRLELEIGAHDRLAQAMRNLGRGKPPQREQREQQHASHAVMAVDGAPPHHGQHASAHGDGRPHAAPHDASSPRARLFHLRRGLPFEQVAVRDEDAVERAHNRVGIDECLMRQHDDGHTELPHGDRGVAQQRVVVRPPRLAARRTQQREHEWNAPRRGHRREREQRPVYARVGQHRPSGDDPQEQRNRREAAPHVVENLPPRDGRERIDRRSFFAGHFVAEPWRKLPVAANPAVQPPRRGEIARGVVVEHFDVGDEPRARERALDEVVAQQRVLGEAAGGRALEHGDLVDALARERPLAEQVLIDVGHGRRVRIDARVAGEDCRVARAVRAGERDAHARLQDSVSLHDPSGVLVEHGAVERMRHGADERDGGVARQHRVGVERDDVAHAVQPVRLSLDPPERTGVVLEQERVELHELAALALPSHPDAVGLVPAALAMEEVEWRSPPLASRWRTTR